MAKRFICNARFMAKKNCGDLLFYGLKDLVDLTRRERGVLNYELYISAEDPDIFIMVEEFADRDAFDFHGRQSYLEKFKADTAHWIESVTVNLASVSD